LFHSKGESWVTVSPIVPVFRGSVEGLDRLEQVRRQAIDAGLVFAASDGFITVVAATQQLWESLCRVIGREEPNANARFSINGPRIRHLKEFEAVLIPVFQCDTSANWLARLALAHLHAGRRWPADARS